MKNYFEVNGINKNSQGDITHIGYFTTYNNGNKHTNYIMPVGIGVWMIENNYELYTIVGLIKHRIGVVDNNGNKYLRSYVDAQRNNNLDNLPILPII